MSDLISRGRARHEFAKFFQDSKSLVDDCDSLLCMLPTIDAVPVVHGRWIHDINNLYGCSECAERETMSPKKLKPYCPNCGAKMDKEN